MANEKAKNGLVSIDKSVACAFGWSNLSVEEQEAKYHHLYTYQTLASFKKPTEYCEYEITTIPKWYVLCEQDKAVLPEWQEQAIVVGKFDHVVRIPSDHAPYLSMPEEFSKVLSGIGEKLSRAD